MNIFEVMNSVAKYSAMGFVFLGGVLTLTYTPVFTTVLGYNLWTAGLTLWWAVMPVVEAIVLTAVLFHGIKKVVELIKPDFFDFVTVTALVGCSSEIAE